MPEATITVLLADDQQMVRSGTKALLAGAPGIHVVGEVRTGNDVLGFLRSWARPDVLVTELPLPLSEGIRLIEAIRARHPGVRVLVLSADASAESIRRTAAAGVSGYITKSAGVDELAHAIRTIAREGCYFSGSLAPGLLRRPVLGSDELTPRQLEILLMVARGMTSKQIAIKLRLSPKTVDVHRGRIMHRLQLTDIAGLTRYALREGLMKP